MVFQPVAYLSYPGDNIYQIRLYYQDMQYTARRAGRKVFNFYPVQIWVCPVIGLSVRTDKNSAVVGN